MNHDNGQVHPVFQSIFESFGMAQKNADKIVQETIDDLSDRPVPPRLMRDLTEVDVHRVLPTVETNEEVTRIMSIADQGERFLAIMESHEKGDISVAEAEIIFEQLTEDRRSH